VKLKKKELPGFYPDWANPTYQIVRVIVFCFYVNRNFPIYQEAIRPYLEAFLFFWIPFTFGSAGSLSNIIAGLILTYMRLFKIGTE
jgi:hypothetical protein